MTLTFEVPGDPVAAPRMTRADKYKQRPVVMRYRAYKDAIRLSMVSAGIRELKATDVDVLEVTVYLATPASTPKKRVHDMIGSKHRSRPDVDNILKSVMDAMFDEDGGISDVIFRKRYGTPRTIVTVHLEKKPVD